jgi:LPPG:FO 2-phospho-L-lactate transferase
MLVILSGGTGTPKLLQGLKEVVEPGEMAIIANTAEDEWLPHGYFSPDIDTILYTMSDQINEKTWYGIKGDTFVTHERLLKLGVREFLNIGDRDRATHIQRGELMKAGKTLSQAVEIQRKALGVKARVYPMSDDPVRTVIVTDSGRISLHEYLIEHGGKPRVREILFEGMDDAKASQGALDALEEAEGIIIGPSNPLSSIFPIISLEGIKKRIQKKKEKCVAVSPIVGGKPVSGPADRFMESKGLEVNSISVAKIYEGLISSLIIDSSDENSDAIEDLGIKCYSTNTIMKSLKDKKALAEFMLKIIYK